MTSHLLILTSIIMLFPTSVQANEYTIDNINVYDGDTIKASVQVWVNLTQKVSIRINGIDTPEIRTRNKCEKALGYKAKQAMIDFIGDNQVTISNVKLGKYAGRVLADMSVGGVDAATYMIKHGYAREYHGGKRLGWCR